MIVQLMRRFSVAEARNNLSALLEQANRGQVFIVTKRGKPYADIVPANQVVRKKSGMSLIALRGSGKDLWSKDSTEWLKKLRKE